MSRCPWPPRAALALSVAVWLLSAAWAGAQDGPEGRDLGDWLRQRLDAAADTSPYHWYAAAEVQVLEARFSFYQAQFDDGVVDSTKWLNARRALQVARGGSVFLPDSVTRGSATYQGPGDARRTLDWQALTAAPVLTAGCREAEHCWEWALEYRYADGSADGNTASFHTAHADWWWDFPGRRGRFRFGGGLRGDAGSFDVRSPLFYYARYDDTPGPDGVLPQSPALDYPFSQAYHKRFFAVGPELLLGMAWPVTPFDATFFVRGRGAVTFGNEHTSGVLAQAVLGALPFDYGEATVLVLWDVQAGLTWRPGFLPDLEVTAGLLAEGGPSSYSSMQGQDFKPAVLLGGFVRLGYVF